MIAQEQAPLARCRNLGSLLEDFGDGFAIFQLQAHEHSGHEREMKCHVKLVALAEVSAQIGRPLVGFGQQHLAGRVLVQFGAQLFQNGVGLRQVLARCSFALDQVGHGIQAESVNSQLNPELHHPPHLLADGGIVVVKVGLMTEETVPVICFGHRVPGPVG